MKPLGVQETALLRALVRAGGEGARSVPEFAFDVTGIDWSSLYRAAKRHHLAPLAFDGYRLLGERLGAAPPWFFEKLLNTRYVEIAKAMARASHVEELGGAAYRENLDLYLLKGSAFATTLYADPGLRPMSDIDLLVAPEAFERWSGLLEEMGYAVVDVSDHAIGFRRRNTGVTVELHRELTSAARFLALDTRAILERSRPLEGAEGIRLRTLSEEDHLLHLSLHASFQHGFRQPAVNAWDARSLAEKTRLSVRNFVARAQAERLAPWIYGGLSMTAALFESPRLDAIRSALAEVVSRATVRKSRRFRTEALLSPAPEAIFGTPIARLGWTGFRSTTFSLLWEISQPRPGAFSRSLSARIQRVLQLVKIHGLAMMAPSRERATALPMSPTLASLGEVRDV
jgi:hypothetical protein